MSAGQPPTFSITDPTAYQYGEATSLYQGRQQVCLAFRREQADSLAALEARSRGKTSVRVSTRQNAVRWAEAEIANSRREWGKSLVEYTRDRAVLGIFASFDNSTQTMRLARIPLWPTLLPACFVAVWILSRLIRVRRLRLANRCVACGYDVRELIGQVCPECGTAIGRGPSAARSEDMSATLSSD